MTDQRDGGIPWCDETWNPIRGCSRVSEGCRNCYAERAAIRQAHGALVTGEAASERHEGAYRGLVKSTPSGPRWTGEVRFVEQALGLPLRWRAPRRIFVNSMSDLFHEKVAEEWIDRIFAVMAQTEHHTYQILTKRPERMRAYCVAMASLSPTKRSERVVRSMYRGHPFEGHVTAAFADAEIGEFSWPLPNVWLGVSVENQATADERIPLLLHAPASVRWVSYEPALGPVDLGPWLYERPGLSWIVCGGESGPGSRPFDLAWARQTISQCRGADVSCFIKQIGASPVGLWSVGDWDDDATQPEHVREDEHHGWIWCLRDRKGGDMAEWPEDLRLREFPRPGAR